MFNKNITLCLSVIDLCAREITENVMDEILYRVCVLEQ